MNTLQTIIVVTLFASAVYSFICSRVILAWALLVATFLLGSTLHAAELPQLSLAVIMDEETSVYYASDEQARQAIAAYVGDVDAIYTQQFGLHVAVVSIQLHATVPTDTQPIFLLSKMVNVPRGNANVLLLLTQRDLRIGEVHYSGYSTAAPLCSYSATSVVTLRHDAFIDGLIIKHELGHAIGLPHDGTGACASESSSHYIMSALSIWEVTQFSQCDVDIVRSELTSNNSCLSPQVPVMQAAAVASTPTQYGGGGSMGESWVLALTFLALIVQSYRAEKWRDRARRCLHQTIENAVTIEHLRGQNFDLNQQIKKLKALHQQLKGKR